MAGLNRRDAWAVEQIEVYRRTGNLEVRDAVFVAYSPLTKLTAARIAHPVEEREDLIQEARIGLFEAIEGWDPEKSRGASFSTWAIAKMRFACVEYARKVIWGTRRMQEHMKKAQRRLTEIENGSPLTEEELQNGGPIMPAHFMLSPLSIDDRLVKGTESDLYIRDVLTDAINCEFAALQNLLHQEVSDGLDWLPDREARVFQLYYYEAKTFREIGRLLKVSESRAFQIHQTGMTRLRLRMKGMDGEEPVVYPYTPGEDIENGKQARRSYRRITEQIAA